MKLKLKKSISILLVILIYNIKKSKKFDWDDIYKKYMGEYQKLLNKQK